MVSHALSPAERQLNGRTGAQAQAHGGARVERAHGSPRKELGAKKEAVQDPGLKDYVSRALLCPAAAWLGRLD